MSRDVLVEGPGCAGINCVSNISSGEWLFGNSATLIWANSIILSENDYQDFEKVRFSHDPVLQESVAILLSGLKREGVIKVIDPSTVMPKISVDSVSEQVESDLLAYGTPAGDPGKNGKREPQRIEHKQSSFCPVVLESLYCSLLLSRFLGCTCLLDQGKKRFVEDRFGGLVPSSQEGLSVFSDFYSVIIPNIAGEKRNKGFCEKELRDTCVHGEECSSEAVKNAKKYLNSLLIARNKPEIVALAKAIDKAEGELGSDKDAISNALLKDINRAQNRLIGTYPKIQAYSRFTGYVSAAAFGACVSLGDCVGAMLSGVAGFASAGLEVGIDRFEKSARWKLAIADSIVRTHSGS